MGKLTTKERKLQNLLKILILQRVYPGLKDASNPEIEGLMKKLSIVDQRKNEPTLNSATFIMKEKNLNVFDNWTAAIDRSGALTSKLNTNNFKLAGNYFTIEKE
jgi:hypothetical protein